MRHPCFVSRTFPALALALAPLVLLARPAAAQQTGAVRGTVTDSVAGRPLGGIQVAVSGTTRGALTDANGVYQIAGVPAGPATLVVRRIGYASVERTVTVRAGETAMADFHLAPVATTTLSAIVSVGYGTNERAQVSSAIASIDSTAFSRAPVAGIDNAIQRRIPGVQVVQNSGEPGSGVSARARGPASLNAGNAPLYMDGVPILQGDYAQVGQSGQNQTAISALNPEEIASIDVLNTSHPHVIRLAEPILTRAEVLARQNRLGDAVTEYNRVRTRAGLRAHVLGTDVTTQAQVLDAIIRERRLELALEGDRWPDLVRLGRAVAVRNLADRPGQALFPIPLRDIRTSPGLTQNPGY